MISPGWVGSLIGLIGLTGLIITFFLYRASRIGPRPVYQYQGFRLIGREKQALPEEVSILYKDKKVARLTKTHIILWNSGKATVNGESIMAGDPLRLEFSKDSEVLSARVLRFTRQSNKFTVDINPDSPNEVICNFDYLDAGDGAVVELLHTDEKRYPKVQGTIRGVPKGIMNWGRILPTGKPFGFPVPLFLSIRAILVIGLISGIFAIAYAWMRPTIPEFLRSEVAWPDWIFVVLGLVIIVMYSSLLWVSRRRFPRSLRTEDTEW